MSVSPCIALAVALIANQPAAAQEARQVYLEDRAGSRLEIAILQIHPDGTCSTTMNNSRFSEHFLSMRPFKCIEGPDKT